MSNIDTSVYEGKRRSIDDSYANQSATGAYSRFLSQQRGSRQVQDFTRGFKREFPSFTAGFANRGLAGGGVRSGVFQRALSDYAGDFSRSLDRMNQDNADSMRNFDLQQAQLDAWRNSAIADLELEKQREIANAASALQAMRPYMSA